MEGWGPLTPLRNWTTSAGKAGSRKNRIYFGCGLSMWIKACMAVLVLLPTKDFGHLDSARSSTSRLCPVVHPFDLGPRTPPAAAAGGAGIPDARRTGPAPARNSYVNRPAAGAADRGRTAQGKPGRRGPVRMLDLQPGRAVRSAGHRGATDPRCEPPSRMSIFCSIGAVQNRGFAGRRSRLCAPIGYFFRSMPTFLQTNSVV